MNGSLQPGSSCRIACDDVDRPVDSSHRRAFECDPGVDPALGKYGLIVTYFIPGLRHLGALAAGASHLAFPSFATYAYLGALLWSGTFVAVGYVLGEEWATFSVPIHQTFTWIALGALLALGGAILIMFRRPLRKP